MFFIVQSNDSFNFPLGLIKYIVIVITVYNFSASFNEGSQQIWQCYKGVNYLQIKIYKKSPPPKKAPFYQTLIILLSVLMTKDSTHEYSINVTGQESSNA